MLVALGSLLVALALVLTLGLTRGAQPRAGATVLTASGTSGAPVGNGTGNGNTDPATGCNTSGNCVKSFGVTVGAVTDLWPGKRTTLPVHYTDPNAFDIRVTDASAAVALLSVDQAAPVTPRTCRASDLTVDGYHGSPGLLVPAKRGLDTGLTVTMSPDAPDNCKRASWTITVTAQAVK
ncbi:MAG: hypothetical protein ACTHNS_11625 [Marmoricola sp.]